MKVDILEIGTSDFNTLAGKANGLFVEPVREYFERLGDCLKERVAISNKEGEMKIYFIPPKEVDRLGLPNWVKGCNSVNEPHKTIVARGWGSHIVSEVVKVIRIKTLLDTHSIDDIEFLKIDTEGHDCIILNDFFDTCSIKPKKIQFEANILSPEEDRKKMKQRLFNLGYRIEERAQDVVCTLENRTIACVLRNGGPLYNSEWVIKLRDSLSEKTLVSHRFVCLSDKDIPSINVIPLEHLDWRRGSIGWWSKMELFRPGLLTGPTIYLDLDTVIVGDISPLFLCCDSFTMLNQIRPNYWASGAMAWSGDFSFLYDRFVENPDYWMDKFPSFPKMGDQAIIGDVLLENNQKPKTFNEYLGFQAIVSYNRCVSGPPKGASAVYFWGRGKPDTSEMEWVKDFWKKL